MKRNLKYTICGVSAAMLALTGCNNDTLPGGDALTEIRLKSGLEVMSRVYTPKQESQIASGEKVYIWSDEASNGVSHFNAWELTADGNGGFDALPDGEKRYFPKSGDAINLYAIHGNFGSGVVKNETAFPVQGNPVVHSVETDQTAGGNYEKSDLLYATKHGIEKTKDAIALEFYHMVSKVEIAIRPGDGLTKENLEGATVKIVNTKTQVEFVPAKVGDLSAANRGEMLSATGTAQDITLPTVSVENDGNEFTSAESYGEVIVVPQELTSGTKFIEVTPVGMAPLYYKLASDFTIESGKKYTFHITVNLTELEVTSSIENWEEGTTEEGGASFVKPQVGDYYYSDGTYSAILSPTKEVIGIVFWVGDPTATDPVLKKDFPLCTQGLVVSLNEGNGAWQKIYDANQSILSWAKTQDFYKDGGYKAWDEDGKYNPGVIQGYNNTMILKAYHNEFKDIYPVNILDYLSTLTEGVTLPDALTSGWYIPSPMELIELMRVKTDVNAALAYLGKTELFNDWFWSSVELDAGMAGIIGYNTDGGVAYNGKTSYYYVRLVFAF